MSEAVKTPTSIANTASLAIYGGEPVRKTPMPPRLALGEDERRMVLEVLDYYAERKVDPGYQGAFEKVYTDAFVEMMGGGYADAVATGTAALYVAVAALDLAERKRSHRLSDYRSGNPFCGRPQRIKAAARGQHA